MGKLTDKEHDFSSKLQQHSVVGRLREYVAWQRAGDAAGNIEAMPRSGPVSINLDLTPACNYACPYCVDLDVINTGKRIALDDIKRTIDTLVAHGLLSVILIGGGEPTLHKDFAEVVGYIKGKGLQLGIVTNGSKLERIEPVVHELREKDWIRLSLDAATEKSYAELHMPKTKITLGEILENARRIKQKNPAVSLGYSYIVVWEGATAANGDRLTPNVDEMVDAVGLAQRFMFDYIAFKPCLTKLEDTRRETLLSNVEDNREHEIIQRVSVALDEAKRASAGSFRVLESANLRAMIRGDIDRIKIQPKRCHMQYFRTVVTFGGIYHCPAFRGDNVAQVGAPNGYTNDEKFETSLATTARSIMGFDAEKQCNEIACFYNSANWWLDDLIKSGVDVNSIGSIEDDNFFF